MLSFLLYCSAPKYSRRPHSKIIITSPDDYYFSRDGNHSFQDGQLDLEFDSSASPLVFMTSLLIYILLGYKNYPKTPKSGICPAPCVLRQLTSPLPPLQYMSVALHESSFHENVVFSVCAHMGNVTYIIRIM